MNLKTVKQRAIEEYYPKEKELETAREMFQKISDYIKKEYGLEAHFAGSAGRGTCRKGDKDLDIFVLFPQDTSRKKLEEKGLRIGKEVFEEFNGDHHVEYAEHPYTKGQISEHEVEIVPCYDADPENIQSAVDRTPHHTRWSKENLDEQQRKDVVALKAFLEAQNLYGSSLKIEGFSGYLCEILIAHYGSFEELIEASANWGEENRIEFNDSEKEFGSDFVVVDPVDSERNVAAVMSKENYARYIFEAWNLYKNPSFEMFNPKDEFDEFELKREVKRRADILVVDFDKPDDVDDIIYPQMRKLKNLLQKKLEKAQFRIYSSGVHADQRCRVFFELERHLPEREVVKGPRVFHNQRHLRQFTEKYSQVFVEDQRLCANTAREYTDAQKFLKDILGGEVSELKEKGIPGGLASNVEESRFADPLSGDEKWLKYLYQKFNCESQ